MDYVSVAALAAAGVLVLVIWTLDKFWHVHHQGWRVIVLCVLGSGGIVLGEFLNGDAAQWKPVTIAIITIWVLGLLSAVVARRFRQWSAAEIDELKRRTGRVIEMADAIKAEEPRRDNRTVTRSERDWPTTTDAKRTQT
jgi:hypothetical protein